VKLLKGKRLRADSPADARPGPLRRTGSFVRGQASAGFGRPPKGVGNVAPPSPEGSLQTGAQCGPLRPREPRVRLRAGKGAGVMAASDPS
jgi:hypothetical protein